jgi:hypothetical protein
MIFIGFLGLGAILVYTETISKIIYVELESRKLGCGADETVLIDAVAAQVREIRPP